MPYYPSNGAPTATTVIKNTIDIATVIPDGYSAYVPQFLEITSGFTLEIGAGSFLEIG